MNIKRYLTLFFLIVATLCFADYPTGSKENIDGSVLGWDDTGRVWRPLSVTSDGKMNMNAELSVGSLTVEVFKDGGGAVKKALVDSQDVLYVDIKTDGTGIASQVEDLATDFAEEIAVVEGDLVDIKASNASEVLKLESLDTKATAINTSIGTVKTAVEEVKEAIGTSTESIADVKTAVDTVGTKVDTANGKLDTVITNQGTINTSIGAAKTSVDTVKTSVDAVKGSVDSVDTSVASVTDKLTTINTTVTTVGGKVDSVNTTITGLKTTADNMKTTLDAVRLINNTIATTTDNIENVASAINSNILSSNRLMEVNYANPPSKRYGFRINQSPYAAANVEYIYDSVGKLPISVDGSTISNWDDTSSSWKSFVYQIARPVMVKYDGTVDYELDRENQTKKIDGTDSALAVTSSAMEYAGNAMVQFNHMYMSCQQFGDVIEVVFCERKLNDTYHDYAFVSSEGVSLPYFYYSMFEGANDGTRVRSVPAEVASAVSNLSGVTMRTNCQANGEGWDFPSFQQKNYINMILVLISKSLDTQAAFGNGNSNNGSFNVIGTTVSQKAFYGDPNGTATNVKALWIENLWGNRWSWCTGVLAKDGYYYVKNTPPFNNDSVSGYDRLFHFCGTSGQVISAMRVCNNALMPHTALLGSGISYKDNLIFSTDSAVRFLRVGGYRNDAGGCGAFAANLSTGLPGTSTYFGCRLSLLK